MQGGFMRKRIALSVYVLSFCLALAVVGPLHAQSMNQGKAPVYTYVAEWSVPRAQWADMEKVADQDRPVLDKLVADGILTGYGAYTNLIHQEGEPTHGTWFSASSEGNLLKALETIYKQPSLVSAPVQAASKHWDQILVDRNYNSKPGASSGYLALSQWEVKPSERRSYDELVKNSLVPMLEKLLAEGTITSYGFDTEDYHQNPIGTVYEYFTVPDAASLDKANQAFEALFGGNPALGDAYRALVKREGHRDFLARIRFMMSK
jgi:hypothetical protein